MEEQQLDLRGMPMLSAIKEHSDCKVFRIINSDSRNLLEWQVETTSHTLIPNETGHYLVEAKIINLNKEVKPGYLTISTPERVEDYVLFTPDNPTFGAIYNLKDEDVIPAIGAACFGNYGLYVSKNDPEIGIEVLINSLKQYPKRNAIAEDLGYLLRDENRLEEALECFLIAANDKPSSVYIYAEIGDIYQNFGEQEKAKEYHKKFENKG